MTKQGVLFLGIITIIIGGVYLYTQKLRTTKLPSKTTGTLTATQHILPTVQISPTDFISYCTPQNLQALVDFNAGAGNIYGSFTLKNISNQTCTVLGGSFITVLYDADSTKNIFISHVGKVQSTAFALTPNQTIYSQVHYPNGPQCQSIGINPTHVTFTYKASPTNTIPFKNQNGSMDQVIQACESSTDTTEIQIWNMSDKPITP